MNEQNNKPVTTKHWISFRVKPEEYDAIHRRFEQTTLRKLSQYARKVLMEKPVTVNYRNQSADEILAAINGVKRELSAIGNNLNQAVHRLHTTDNYSEIKSWATVYENTRQVLLEKSEAIRLTLAKIEEQWCRK